MEAAAVSVTVPRPGGSTMLTVIEADQPRPLLNLPELWRHRELLGFLAWRDVRVRYRQTLLGAIWALIEPLASVVLFTLIFNRLAGFESGSIPYPVHCYAGVLIWTFFSRALRTTTLSLVANAGLVTKVYFPRLLLPLASQLATLVDLGCALLMFLMLLAVYGLSCGVTALTLPLWILLAVLNALGVGLVLASVNVRYRDVSQAVPFLVQVWMFATPVAYPLTAIPASWVAVYALNPMVGVVEGMRWALLPGYAFDGWLLVPSVGLGSAVLLGGLLWFRRSERRFADIV
jgi:lipopolysaccharide transport system permease protein